jgi:signal transduction histidine kinase
MTVILGLIVLPWAFVRVLRHLHTLQHQRGVFGAGPGAAGAAPRGRSWYREMRRWELGRHRRGGAGPAPSRADIDAYRALRHGAGHAGFFGHLLVYLGVITLLALINLFSSREAWFVWPAMGWGFGLFAHWMGVFGRDAVRAHYVEPVVDREVVREKVALQTEKQADIGELSATIAHEIRNPIAAAKSLVQQMAEAPQSIENIEYAKVAVEELDRVERRIAHLLRYAREEDYAMAPVGLATVVDGALTQLRAKLDAGRVQAIRHYISGPTVQADAQKLQGVFVNVLDNAIDALAAHPEPRRIEVMIENGGAEAAVRLRDNGPGIAPEPLAQIWNPFFTTKNHGTGLGLAIAKKTVEAHGGTMSVTSQIGQGTEFVVTLPLPR